MADQAAPVPLTPVPVLDGTNLHTGRKALSERLPRPWLFPLAVFAATWVMIVATWNIANRIYGTHWTWSKYFWIWDSGFYGAIAKHGYGPMMPAGSSTSASAKSAFFPLYPMVIRAFMIVTDGRVFEAGLITQILAGGASAIGVWMLARHVYGHRVADRAVLLYCGFFGATVLGWMYTEPLAVALAAFCLLATLKRQWLLAGALALLAGAEHSTMIVLCPVLGIVALREIWTRRDWRSLIAPVLAPLGLLAYFAYFGHRYHNYLFWFQVERVGWQQHTGVQYTLSVLTGRGMLASAWHAAPLYYAMVAAGFWIALIAVGLLVIDRAPLPVTLFTAAVLVMCAISSSSTKPRFVFTMTGIFLIYAAKLPAWVFWPLLVASAALEAYLLGYWPHSNVAHTFPSP
jgi:hypothetical protein